MKVEAVFSAWIGEKLLEAKATIDLHGEDEMKRKRCNPPLHKNYMENSKENILEKHHHTAHKDLGYYMT